MISESPEGRIHDIPIRGLKTRYAFHRLAEGLRGVPVLGRGLLFLRVLGRMPERIARLEQSIKAQDSAGRYMEEMRGRLGSVEDRLDRLERVVRYPEGNQGRRDADDKLRGQEAEQLRGGAERQD